MSGGFGELQDLYGEVILDHNRRPRNFGRLPGASHSAVGHNPLCGDRVEVTLRVEDGRIDLPTSAAIRRFQEDQGLARTGNPDHETVRRLGIDPDALFRKSSDAKKRAQ